MTFREYAAVEIFARIFTAAGSEPPTPSVDHIKDLAALSTLGAQALATAFCDEWGHDLDEHREPQSTYRCPRCSRRVKL